jgi:23S rRNA (cytosine1962-C5)-methyltransferase
MAMLKLVLFEDDHLLVVNKPAGMNTHAPAPFAGEGLYDWLKNREPRWANLALLHRLDKETSGVMVFGKSPAANQSLARQFAERRVRKRYLLQTDRPAAQSTFTVTSSLVRTGERYVSRPVHAGSAAATTRFKMLEVKDGRTWLEAEPVTGRTHQVRVHAASRGLPIRGDTLYGGSPAPRLCLHAARLAFQHPATHEPLQFEAPPDFTTETKTALRDALLDENETNAFRLVHGGSDGWPGWFVDRLGEFLLSQSDHPLDQKQVAHLKELLSKTDCSAEFHSAVSPSCTRQGGELDLRPSRLETGDTQNWKSALQLRQPNGFEPPGPVGAYHKLLDRQVRRASSQEASPRRVLGPEAPERFAVRENGLGFELSLCEGYSVGLFLDQRENRRRLLTGHVAAGFPLFRQSAPERHLLNTFAYTCAFSVCAARSGLRTTSLDLSRHYLEWGRRNFARNGLDPAGHEFIHGDVFEWLRRLARRHRVFDLIILDPPTFSQSKAHGAFRAEKDYGQLLQAALPLLASEGVLLASTNAARYEPARFLDDVRQAIQQAGRRPEQEHYAPQPVDFPITRAEPAYLKTVWVRVC